MTAIFLVSLDFDQVFDRLQFRSTCFQCSYLLCLYFIKSKSMHCLVVRVSVESKILRFPPSNHLYRDLLKDAFGTTKLLSPRSMPQHRSLRLALRHCDRKRYDFTPKMVDSAEKETTDPLLPPQPSSTWNRSKWLAGYENWQSFVIN